MIGDDTVGGSKIDLLDHGFGKLLLEIAAEHVGLEEDGDSLDFRSVERSVTMPAEEPRILRVDARFSDVSAATGETGEHDGGDQSSNPGSQGSAARGSIWRRTLKRIALVWNEMSHGVQSPPYIGPKPPMGIPIPMPPMPLPI